LKLLITDSHIALGGVPDLLIKDIKAEFTFKDMSKTMTRGGFDKRKVKNVCFAGQKGKALVFRAGFLKELLLYLKSSNVKLEEIQDKRTKLITEKYTDGELRKYFNPDFKYVKHQIGSLQAMLKTNIGIIKAPTSAGKCFGENTEILMFDGSIKKVQKVVVGDTIMGWDSTPRKVLSTTSGVDTLYKIKNLKGNGFHIVNSSHVITLKATRTLSKEIKKNDVIDISLKEYLLKNKDFKKVFKLFQEPVIAWPEASHKLDPYFLGVWLGDGRSNAPSITSIDNEIIEYLYEYAECFSDLSVSVYEQEDRCNNYVLTGRKKQKNAITEELRRLNLINNKHIPNDFLIDNFENRLKLLAGLLDTDGYLDKKRGVFEFSQKNKRLSSEVVFLAKSLGFYASMNKGKKKSQNGIEGLYYSLYIAGDIWKIPTKIKRKQASPKIKKKHELKDPTKIGFSVKKLDEGDYYGFTVDGDGRFMLGDFIVSHNTEIIIAYLMITKLPCLVLVDSVSLATQTVRRFTEAGLSCGICTGKGKIDGDHVVSTIGSYKKLGDLTRYKTVIVDECHIVGSKSFQEFFELTNYPYRYGFSATPDGNDKYRFATVRQHIGDILFEIYTKELIENDVMAKPVIKFLTVDCIATPSWDSAYDKCIVNNKRRNEKVIEIAEEHKNVPVLILYKIIEHGKVLGKKIPNSVVLSGSDSNAVREEAIAKFISGEIKCLIASNIFKQGISISNIEVLINVSGGKSKIEVLQKIGRSLRLSKGKTTALVYDFMDLGNKFTEKHSLQREDLYKKNGFTDIEHL